jgi:hypothetical protein
MTEKVRKLSIFLQSLSRLPGLGFLAQTERDLREAADQVDEVGDQYEEGQRQLDDVRRAAGEVVSSDDDS